MFWFWIIGAIVVLMGFVAFVGAPYVPSHRRDVRRLFEKGLPLKKTDTLVDIGSGDGLVLREAARLGATAIGLEIHPLLVFMTRLTSRRYGRRVQVRLTNAWTAQFPDETTVVYAFSVRRDGKKLLKAVKREATRLGRPLTLACYGTPLQGEEPSKTFEAFYIYTISA